MALALLWSGSGCGFGLAIILVRAGSEVREVVDRSKRGGFVRERRRKKEEQHA
jgi:hypothetical protein